MLMNATNSIQAPFRGMHIHGTTILTGIENKKKEEKLDTEKNVKNHARLSQFVSEAVEPDWIVEFIVIDKRADKYLKKEREEGFIFFQEESAKQGIKEISQDYQQ